MKITLTIETFIIAAITLLFNINYIVAENKTVSKLNWFDNTFKTLSWEEITLKVNTPYEICSAVRHHIKYKSDPQDEWATGKKAWNRGYGDCEDIAAAISDLCAKKDIKTQIFILYPEFDTIGHVIVVGKWNNKTWFSSNGWFEYAKNESDVKKKIIHEMQWKNKSIVTMDWNSFRGINLTIYPAADNKENIIPIM